MSLQRQLEILGVDLSTAIEQLAEPAALVGADGTVLWQNKAAIDLVGEMRGRSFAAIAPDYQQQSRASLARKLMGVNPVSHSGTVVVGTDGSRNRIETISLSLTDGNAVVGVLGIVRRVSSERIAPVPPRLSPRLQETLVLLAAGQSTEQVAASLGVAPETARNYIRRLLRALGAHSRLEAVVHGREAGLV